MNIPGVEEVDLQAIERIIVNLELERVELSSRASTNEHRIWDRDRGRACETIRKLIREARK